MPLSLYEAICDYAFLPKEYAMDKCRMRLHKDVLRDAIIKIMGDMMPSVVINASISSGMSVDIAAPPAVERDRKELWDAATMLAHMIDGEYDQIHEKEYRRPLDHDER